VALLCIYIRKLNNNKVIKNRLNNYLIPPFKIVVNPNLTLGVPPRLWLKNDGKHRLDINF